MSTAHRPTWKPKQGGGGLRDGVTAPPTSQSSSKDQPSHKRLKYTADLLARADDQFADFFAPPANLITSGDCAQVSCEEDLREEMEASDAEEESDDEEELMRELSRIRAERAAQKQQTTHPATHKHQQPEGLIIQRRWEEEGVVFRRHHVQKDPSDSKNGQNGKKRFINDTVRSDQHRDFMNKYVK